MLRLEESTLLRGRYLLRHPIRGVNGTPVWEADDLVVKARVSVAIVETGGDEEAVAERRRRIEALRWPWFSPNTQLLLDSGEEEGLAFVVVELVAGETVEERLRRTGRLEPGEAARIAVDVADALQAVHDVGLAHGEVDPAHVAITEDGRVKLFDLAVRAVSGQAVAGEAERRTDVRALGSLLYEMLTGAPPTDPPTHPAEPGHGSTLAEVAPWVPSGLVRACDQARSDDPEDRPPTASAFASIVRMDAGPPPAAAGWVVDLDERWVRGPDLTITLDHEEPHANGQRGPWDPSTDPPARAAQASQPAPASIRGTDLDPVDERSPRRALLLGIAALVIVAVIVAGLILAGRIGPPAIRRAAPSPAAPAQNPTPAPASLRVPDVAGMTVDEARTALLDAHLVLGGITPTLGRPGEVVRSDPPAGSSLSAEGVVTLYVGVPPGRLRASPAG